MLAKITIDIPYENDKYPDNSQLVQQLRMFGWEASELSFVPPDAEIARVEKIKELSIKVLEEIPSIEKNSVIFYGYLQENQTEFVVTRISQGQITFWIYHLSLSNLQVSVSQIIKKILGKDILFSLRLLLATLSEAVISIFIGQKEWSVTRNEIIIYERQNTQDIITGKIITNRLNEILKNSKKDIFIAIVTLILFGISQIIYNATISFNDTTLTNSLNNFAIGMLGASVTTFLGLVFSLKDLFSTPMIKWEFSVKMT